VKIIPKNLANLARTRRRIGIMGAKGEDGIFRYADSWDMWLMLFGTLGSIGDGLQNPLMMFILSDVINDYGSGKELTNEVVNKVSMLIIFFFV
jgi:ATP-binding cassette subfamily B (MDR/TAP) protein 1